MTETPTLQGGMSNAELLDAWKKKLPGVTPTDREVSAFAVGIEVGFARALEAQAAQIAERDAQIEALRADALRYRWLVGARTKEQASNEDVGAGVPLPQDELLETFASWYFDKEAADAAIDAAMAAKGP